MKILVIGSGGREHAIAWKLSKSARSPRLVCAPGNPGMAQIGRCLPSDVQDAGALANLAESIGADLTVVGPEAPLVAGVADVFSVRNLRIVGPTQAAARLEGSKIFAKEFMARNKIPTARFTVCDSPESARATLDSSYEFPVVAKADGLAAGKGVRIAADSKEFDAAINAMMVERVFGEAGSRVVLEECLVGEEASLMIFTDGADYKAIAPARDYKRVWDGDRGPNTGGMGSFSTPGLIDEQTLATIQRRIIEPTLEGMRAEGCPFRGVLYVGLMLTADGPRVIEYNARLGDPETQAILPRLQTDLVDIFDSIADGGIGRREIAWSKGSCVCVVAASSGYPEQFERGKRITGLEEASSMEGTVVFHAGTAIDSEDHLITAGGRVVGVTALGPSLEEARARAYQAIEAMSFDGIHYRRDIARY
jgi:phosphoribosylamine--glycine ligase